MAPIREGCSTPRGQCVYPVYENPLPKFASITPRLGTPLLFVDDKCCRNAALCGETQFRIRIRGELPKLPELLQKSSVIC